ncbi:MAG: hypothetical protein K2P95_04620 [Hyphomonadaceae bacterium]|nr:hypothetical protein [Hyphomonadaceae bacterium]
MLNETESLKALTQAREAVADRLDKEAGWYDPLYSVLVGGMIASQALPFPYGTLAIGMLLPVLAVLYTTKQRRAGVRMWGVTPKRARWVALGLGAVCLCLMLAAVWLGLNGHRLLALATTGPAGAAVAFVASKLWRRVFRAELRGAA